MKSSKNKQINKKFLGSGCNSDVLNHRIEYSVTPTFYATNVELVSQTIGDFIEKFERPMIQSYCLEDYKKEDAKTRRDMKSGCCYTLATFGTHRKKENGSFRNDENVLAISGIGIDIDNDDPNKALKLVTIRKRLEGTFNVIHTTHSSSVDEPRYRAIVFYKSPINAEQYPAVFAHFSQLLGQGIDKHTSDTCRLSLFPSCPKDQVDSYYIEVNDGELFDTTIVRPIEVAKKIKKEKLPKKLAEAPITDLPDVNLDNLPINKKIKTLIISGDASKHDGDRSNLVFDVTQQLVKKGLDDAKILAILLSPEFGISERCREKGLEWTQEEVDRIRSKTRFIEGVEPYYPEQKVLTKKQAKQELNREVSHWFKQLSDNSAVEASAGLGKTTSILNEIANDPSDRFYEIYVPKHSLGQQLCNKLLEINPDIQVKVIQGRDYKASETDLPLCKKAKAVTAMYTFGYSVYNVVCRSCIFFNNCQYLAQYTDTTKVRIFTHAHLPLDRGLLDNNFPDAVIIDETFISIMLDIRPYGARQIETQIENVKLRETLLSVISGNKSTIPELHNVFGHNLISVLDEEIGNKKIELPEINGSMLDEEITSILKNNDSIVKRRNIIHLLSQIKIEFEKFPNRQKSLSVRVVESNLVVSTRKQLTRFVGKDADGEIRTAPILLIDADFKKEVVRRFIPEIHHREIRVKRNCNVTQVYSTTNAKTRFKPRENATEEEKKAAAEHLQNLSKFIAKVEKKHGKTLLISYKSLLPNANQQTFNAMIFNLSDDQEYVHFGGLRGSNQFEDCNAVVVIGRHQIPVDAVESEAAALWWDSKNELNLTGNLQSEMRGFRCENKKLGVLVDVCSDERTQMLMELHRECETLQGIDRLRLILNKEPKHVYILSNLPLDIDVDRLVSLKNVQKTHSPLDLFNKALKTTECGVLPISPSYLTEHYPSLFESVKKANVALKEAGFAGSWNTFFLLNSCFYMNIYNRKWNLIEFTAHGKSKKRLKALAYRTKYLAKVQHALESIYDTRITIHHTLDFQNLSPSEWDSFADDYYRMKQEYVPLYGAWAVTVV